MVAPLSFYLSSQRLAETDEKDIYGIFYADIVTCHTNKGNPYFTCQTTDSAPVDTLYPVSEVNSDDMGEGVRVLRNTAR